ncbi:MAG: DUF599 family protein [Motiliproteus sp.]|nr:DUF599 family protein [Motiliproteus sp.]MCW9054281.1 DUF599 family protein [Motiliproteus sp.]
MNFDPLLNDWPSLAAIVWFLICFKGYALFAQIRARTTPCLANVLHLYRVDWMRRMLDRDVRIADISAVANLERSVAFFASSTILILAGLVTALGASDKIVTVVSDVPILAETSKLEWEIKLLVIIVVFIYAFFKFTWSLRQYGFCAVLIGSAPMPEDGASEMELKAFIERSSKMISMAANNFNFGLRSYYFSMALLAWFINSWCFIGFSTIVVMVLYLREFKSPVLSTLMVSIAEGDHEPMDFRQELHK